jgi:hypothetical protein
MRPRNTCLVSHERAPPFYLTCKKRYLIVYSPCRPLAPVNGCHATGTREAHALHEVGGLRGAQAIRNLRTGRKSWV